MAKVSFVREGSDPTTGTPAYDISLQQCIDQLGLTKNDWLHGLDQKTHFHARRIVAAPEHRHVVCEIDEQEASEEVEQDFICWRSAQDRLRGGSGQLEWAEKRAGAASARLGPGRQITIGRWPT